MAAYVGKDGGFFYPNSTSKAIVPFIDTWQLTPTLGTAEVTAYGDSAVKRVATIRDWSCQVSGTLDRSSTAQNAFLKQLESTTLADIGMQFYCTTSRTAKYWKGSGIPSQASIGSKVNDKVSVSFSFVADGALTWTS